LRETVIPFVLNYTKLLNMFKLTKTRLSLLSVAAVMFFSVLVISCNSAETAAEEKKDTSTTQQPATVGPDTTAKSAVTDSLGVDTVSHSHQAPPPPNK
jgi:hypothetical protein